MNNNYFFSATLSAKLSATLAKLNKRFNAMLKKRKHFKQSLTLNHSNIYIFPSKFGLAFVALTILVYVLGINYQNNLVLLCSYLMLSFLLVNFVIAFSNLYNLTIKLTGLMPGFQHSGYSVNLQLSNTANTASLAIEIDNAPPYFVSNISSEVTKVSINVKQAKRGKHRVPRIKLFSRYPFGLVTTWSYLLSDNNVYIYPTPLAYSIHKINLNDLDVESDPQSNTKSLSENYHGVRPYQDGDKVNRISWKHYAKNQVLATKDFSTGLSSEYVFSLNSVPGNTEQKLQHLCYLLTHAEQEQLSYSLLLPKKQIALGSGKEHLTLCLEAISDV